MHLFTKKISESLIQQQHTALTLIEDKALDLEVTKPLIVDEDKETNYALSTSEYHEEIQEEKKPIPLTTKEISEEQAKQQTKALNSVEDEALDTELIKTIHVDNVEINRLHLQASSTCCEMNGFYFIEDEITNFSYDCRYHTKIELRTDRLLQTRREFRHKELQEGPLTWKHVHLLSNHEVSTAFTFDNTRNHEGNAELRAILFEEGGNDPNMDHEDNLQTKTNQGGGDMARQPTDLMLIDLPTVLAEHIDLDVTMVD